MGPSPKRGVPVTHGQYVNGREGYLHYVWRSMLTRCENPRHKDYPQYGGRGITVCDEWHDYSAFANAVGDRPSPAHSLERERVNEGYKPGNCRWATRSEQQLNKTTTRLWRRGATSEVLAPVEWARRLGISKALASWRAKHWGGFTKDETWQQLPKQE